MNRNEIFNERKNTFQFPNNIKEEQKLFQNQSVNEFYPNSSQGINIVYPNLYSTNNNTSYITSNTRKWFKASPGKNSIIENLNNINNTITNNNTLKKVMTTEISENNFLFLPIGDKYEGEILNNKPHGHGKYYSATGEIREGTFFNGQLNGKGRMNLTNGVFLEGNFMVKYTKGNLLME